MAALSDPTRSSPVCRWQLELIDDSGTVVIRSSQDVTEPFNTAQSDSAEDDRLAGPSAVLLIGPVQPIDSHESAGLEAKDAGGEGYILASYSSTERTAL